ncbi:MAG TPA: glycosyltransferase family protein [Parachlamydiaceae bacterium]|nr:glycosyltransferase family protein [Parachlamydiaceae bacterium]
MKKKELRCVILVQARVGSTRLPGKVLKEVLDKPLLQYIVERLKRVELADEVVIATTTEKQDDAIVDFCQAEEIPLFRGKSEDVLDRFYKAASAFKADVIIRITADCPLIDPKLIDEVIHYYLDHYPKYDYVSNSHVRSFPIGMDAEVFSFKALKEAFQEGSLEEEREHVTPFIYRRPNRYARHLITHEPDLSHLRLTVDTQEDFDLIKLLIEELYPHNKEFSMDDILKALKEHPEWVTINANVKQKELR